MKKPNIKRLNYPIWFQIIFLFLTFIIPLVLVMVEGFKSPSDTFKITFGVISSLLIIWVFVNHFIVLPFKKKINERKTKLEHDYEIDVGDSTKIKWLWFTNEIKIAIFNAISVLLYGGLFAIVLTAISKQLMSIRGIILMIAICYVSAYVLKFITLIILRGKEDETTE